MTKGIVSEGGQRRPVEGRQEWLADWQPERWQAAVAGLSPAYGDRFIAVPLLASEVGDDIYHTRIAFEGPELLSERELRNLGLTGELCPGRLIAADVVCGRYGEAMVPTIAPGAALLIDRGGCFVNGKMYLLAVRGKSAGTVLKVRRVWLIADHLVLLPDNVKVNPDRFDSKDPRRPVCVVGRVVRVANPA